MIKCFQAIEEVEITALNYGPYDNGHILLGFSSGNLLVLNQLDLSTMHRIKPFNVPMKPITSITFDPTKMIICSSFDNTNG